MMDFEAAYRTEFKAVHDIWKIVDQFANADIDQSVHTESIVEMVRKLKAERDRMHAALQDIARTSNAGYVITDQTREEVINLVGDFYNEFRKRVDAAKKALAQS